MNLKHYLSQQVEQALTAAGAEDAPAIIRQSSKPEFGHYQANGVMGAAKRLGTNPRELALRTVDELNKKFGEKMSLEVAGPGFINITLSNDFIASSLSSMAEDERLGGTEQMKQRVVVVYSSPNLAKEMHIGHLRSTTIGDANVKIMEFLGHDVIRANHVGDWGTQFGLSLIHI